MSSGKRNACICAELVALCLNSTVVFVKHLCRAWARLLDDFFVTPELVIQLLYSLVYRAAPLVQLRTGKASQ